MSPQADLQPRAEELFQLPWSREVLADEDGCYLARVPELPGCFADGDTVEEALANLNVVLREWLVISVERGDRIPEPRRVDDSFRGRVARKRGHEMCPSCSTCGLTNCPDCDTEGRTCRCGWDE